MKRFVQKSIRITPDHPWWRRMQGSLRCAECKGYHVCIENCAIAGHRCVWCGYAGAFDMPGFVRTSQTKHSSRKKKKP
jgi:hypothetical protein